MQFICTQENLARGLMQVAPLAGRNLQLPILQSVLCQAKDGMLYLTGTDLEIGVRTSVPGKVAGEGSWAVPARKMLEFVQQLPGDHPLTLTKNEQRLVVETERFKAAFPTTEADDFPLLPTGEATEQWPLPANSFCEGLSKTLFASAKENTRPEIHSVYMRSEENKIYLAATDSFRLSEVVFEPTVPVGDFSFLLPLTTAHELIRLFGREEVVYLKPQENYLIFQSGGVELSSRLVEGTYPDYKYIIPTNYKLEGVVERELLSQALKTVAVFLPRDSRRVTLEATPQEERLTVRVASGGGEGEVIVPWRVEGEAMSVLFNITYLMEGLQHLKTEQCRLQFSGAAEPVVFRPETDKEKFLYVVMPIQG